MYGLSATFTLFPDRTNWYHGLFWQLSNHHHTTDKSSSMLNQCMSIFSGHTHSLNKSIGTISDIEKSFIEMMDMTERNTSTQTPNVKGDLSDSMETIVQLALIKFCYQCFNSKRCNFNRKKTLRCCHFNHKRKTKCV